MQPGFCLHDRGVGWVLEQMAIVVDDFAALDTSPSVVKGHCGSSLVL